MRNSYASSKRGDKGILTVCGISDNRSSLFVGRRGGPMMPRLLLALVCLMLLTPIFTTPSAQYITFGKNKVNYRDFDWQVLDSEHFKLYYYPDESELAQMAIAWAEYCYSQHRRTFAHEVRGRIPVIIYSSHHDFEQTNITPMFLSEGVAGLTELMRGRVLVPFNGSVHQFFHTLRHELVHAFQLSMSERAQFERFRVRRAHHPLWFTEGLAEHWSSKWDPDGDLILRDLVISGKLPAINEFWRYRGSFVMYKLGQSVLDFIAETYGDDKVTTFYTDNWKRRYFSELFPVILGVTEEELSSRWMHWMRERYYPDVLSGEPILHSSRRISKWSYTLKPTPVPDTVPGWEDQYLFISSRSGYTSLYTASLTDPHVAPRRLLQGQKSSDLQSFHGYRSRLDISPQGHVIFSSHRGDRDILIAYDLVREEVVDRWAPPDLVGITSPQWDAAGERIVFSGLARSGQADIYLLHVATGELVKLTEDWFFDTEPTFHPDGDRVVFVSDRCDFGRHGALNLFEVDLDIHFVSTLTHGDWWDLSPSWSPDGEQLVFVSTRDGMRDLYLIDGGGDGYRATRALEAIQDPRWLPGGKEILASLYHGGRTSTVVIPVPETPAEKTIHLSGEPTNPWVWETHADSLESRPGDYESTYALDIAQGGIAVQPGLGAGEGVQVLLRDLMGNRLMFFQLGNTTISTEAFLDNLSIGMTFVDLSRRLNRGWSLFHHAGTYYDEFGVPYFQRRAGGHFLFSYPFSRYNRVETKLGLAYSEKDKPSARVYRSGILASQYVSYIHDTALWTSTGPIDGERRHLTLGLNMNLSRPGVENYLILADARKYIRTGSQSCVAVRLQGRLSGGPDPQVFLLGGPYSLRSFSWRSIHGTRSLMANVELRFPLLHGFLLAPAGVGTLGFPGIQGIIFFDAGDAWYNDWTDEWWGNYGFGFRMGLGGLMVLRLDFARRTDFDTWPSRRHTEFYIGWNY
jgi:WD40-like Beta Propeller Repeat